MGMRTVFRVIQTIFSAIVFIFFVIPVKICRRYHRTISNYVRDCIPREMRSIYCPHFQIDVSEATKGPSQDVMYDDSEFEVCPRISVELIWTTLMSLVLLLVYLVDWGFGRQFMVKQKKWSMEQRRRFYWIFLGATSAVWLSILIAMSVVLAVQWPKAVAEQQYENPWEQKYLEKKWPPARWIATLIIACVMPCVKAVETATLYMLPEKYFETSEEEIIDAVTKAVGDENQQGFLS